MRKKCPKWKANRLFFQPSGFVVRVLSENNTLRFHKRRHYQTIQKFLQPRTANRSRRKERLNGEERVGLYHAFRYEPHPPSLSPFLIPLFYEPHPCFLKSFMFVVATGLPKNCNFPRDEISPPLLSSMYSVTVFTL